MGAKGETTLVSVGSWDPDPQERPFDGLIRDMVGNSTHS
jgi:hypothetical protein